jgi:signal transduction histidine kinase
MLKDIEIPEATAEEVLRVYNKKIEQQQIITAMAAGALQSLWYVSDYVLMPEARLKFFIWRISVLLLPIFVCLFRKQLRISASGCLFFSGTLTALMISVVMCSAPESVFQTYVLGYCILFIAAGALANLKPLHSILFPLVSLAFNLILYYFLSPLDFGMFLTEALVPIYSFATIAFLLIEARKKMQLKEISSRMEIDRSRKIIEAQKNKLNEELDNFVYSVSHDLRSPLLSVKGILSLILTTEKLNADAEKYMHMAQGSIDRLDNTIQDILEYSRNSRLDVKLDHFDIRPVVQHIFDDIQFVSDNPMRFEIEIEGDSMVYTDQTRLSTIIKNLASNAAKYRNLHHEQCLVRFELRTTDRAMHFKVIDNGIGIPDEEKDKVFQMFYRVSTDRMGTGLGLFIVKEITNKLKGTIVLESNVNEGTSVEIILPVMPTSTLV